MNGGAPWRPPFFVGSCHAKNAFDRGPCVHLVWQIYILVSGASDAADQLGGVFAIRAQQAACLGAGCADHALRCAVHDGWCLYPGQKRSCARRCALRFFPAAHAGHDRPDPLHRVFFCRASSRSPGPAGTSRTRRWPSANRRSTPTRCRSIPSSLWCRLPASSCCCRAWWKLFAV